MFLNILFAALFLLGLGLLLLKIAKDKGWALPAGLVTFLAGVSYWFNDIFDKVGGMF